MPPRSASAELLAEARKARDKLKKKARKGGEDKIAASPVTPKANANVKAAPLGLPVRNLELVEACD